jgi:hypothetical protein
MGRGHATKQTVSITVEVVQLGDFDTLREEAASQNGEEHPQDRPDPINAGRSILHMTLRLPGLTRSADYFDSAESVP